jgi:hypothetical protein
MNIDSSTEQHLKAWVRKEFGSQWERVFNAMRDKLHALDDEDYDHALEGGWWKFYDSIPELKDNSV